MVETAKEVVSEGGASTKFRADVEVSLDGFNSRLTNLEVQQTALATVCNRLESKLDKLLIGDKGSHGLVCFVDWFFMLVFLFQGSCC